MSLFLLNNGNTKKYILEKVPGAAAAYSFRQLSKKYCEACIRVRRSSDNAETDIGFLNNNLDTVSLLSFVGSGNGFITKWYDQSGNNNYCAQSTAGKQPQIVTGGIVNKINNKPAIRFYSANINSLLINNTALFANKPGAGLFSVCSITSANSLKTLFFASGISSSRIRLDITAASVFEVGGRRLDSDSYVATTGTTVLTTNVLKIISAIFDTPNANLKTFIDCSTEKNIEFQTAGNFSNTNSGSVEIGSLFSTSNNFEGYLSELIIYNSAIQNGLLIQNNQKNHFGV